MPILSYSQVTKRFGPDLTVLDTVSFSVEPGELIVLTGQTGCGKTTLMKLLTREYTPTSGEIYFHDLPVHSLKLGKVHLLRRQLGIVFQDYRLIRELNVWENIASPLYIVGKKDAEIEQRVSDLLNLIKLTDRADAFPSQLSGGEAQRVAIARSLALAPELLFADEPTGNLDSETSKGIAALLGKINELGTTVIIATHDLTLLELFATERHLQLNRGKIVSDQKRTTPTTPNKAADVEEKVSINSSNAVANSPQDSPTIATDRNTATTSSDLPAEKSTASEPLPIQVKTSTEPMTATETVIQVAEEGSPDQEPISTEKSEDDVKISTRTDTQVEITTKRSFWHRLRLGKKPPAHSAKHSVATAHDKKPTTDSDHTKEVNQTKSDNTSHKTNEKHAHLDEHTSKKSKDAHSPTTTSDTKKVKKSDTK